MSDPLLLIPLAVIVFFTSALSAVIGMGGGVTLLSVMTFFLPWQQLVPLHGVIQMVSNTSRAGFLMSHIRWSFFGWFALGAPFGAVGAVLLVKEISDPDVFFLLIALLILYTLFKPKRLPAMVIPSPGFTVVGVISGFIGILIGSTGPFLAPLFLRPDFTKEQIIATKAALQTVTHFLKIPSFLFLGFAYSDHIGFLIVLPVSAVLGTRWGTVLLKKLPEAVFLWLYQGALAVAALRLLWKAFV